MYNPIELSKKTEDIVINGKMKKYYRFRPTRFYDGIVYSWLYYINRNYGKITRK